MQSLLKKHTKGRLSGGGKTPFDEVDEKEKKRSDLRSQIHRTIDVMDEPEDLEALLAHCQGVAGDCLKKKSGGPSMPAKEESY